MNFRRSILLLPLLLLACDHATEPEFSFALPAIDVPWTEGQTVVCYGTSLTYGYMGFAWPLGTLSMREPELPKFVSEPAGVVRVDTVSYPYHLGQQLRIRVVNAGIVGATTENALAVVGDSVFSKNPALVLLEFGANEFLRINDVAIVEPRLTRLIDTLQAQGATVLLVSFLSEEMINSTPADHFMASRKEDAWAYLNMLRRVADDQRILFVEQAMRGIYWNATLLSDAVHPNRAGYRLMAENIYASLQATFERNGMKR